MDVIREDEGAGRSWPSLSADDLHRLRFFAYLRRTGRLRPPTPVGAEADALCAILFREPSAPRAAIGGRHDAYYGGLPPLWREWVEKQKLRER